jgi:hypothetical protein
VSVTATDLDNKTATQTLTATITDTYATWAARQTFTGGQNASAQNPDGDALNNLLEYALLGNPAINSPTEAPAYALQGIAPAARYMSLAFPVRKFTSGLIYTVEASAALTGAWAPIWTSTDGLSQAQVQSSTELADRTNVVIKDTAAISSGNKRFLRLKVSQN